VVDFFSRSIVLSILKWLVTRLAAVGWIIKILGSLGLLIPLAFLFKVIGLPLLAILGVLAVPVLFMLLIFGLPIFLVLIVGGGVLGLLFTVLSVGMLALKFAIFVVLPVYVVFKLLSWIFGRRRGTGGKGPSPPPSTSSDPVDGVHPAI
jgi:hypothetical protein